jgi:hypothetical protein
MACDRFFAVFHQNDQGILMLTPFFIIPRFGRVAYLNNPKAACSSILLALSQMRLGRNFQPPHELLPDGSHPIHGFHPEHAHLEYFFRRWPLSYPPLPGSLVKFTFVRNPYARFYSFYKSKVLSGQAPGNYYERFGLRKGCSFGECVRIITSVDPWELEHHAAPQSMLLYNDEGLLVDFVGKVEEFSRDWLVINNLTGCNLHLDHLNRMESFGPPEYSAEEKELIFNYYRDDFLLFGYEEDSVQLTGEPREVSAVFPYSRHYLAQEAIEKYRHDIDISNEKVRSLASEFAQNQSAREEFFGKQDELFRELILKASSVIEKKTNENARRHVSLQQDVAIATRKIDDILKFNNLCREKFFEINSRFIRENTGIQERLIKEKEEIQRQLKKEKDEIGRIRNLLYQHVMATFRHARRSRWKRLCRLLRSPRQEEKILRDSGLVDPHYYFENYPQAMKPGMTAAEHYVRLGAQDGYNPSAQFNTRQYLVEHPDVAHDGINPLVHYIVHRQRR